MVFVSRFPPSYDVVVVGAGPAGCATALGLARQGVERVLVLDASDEDRGPSLVRVGESVPPETRLVLDRLGVWDRFVADGHEHAFGTCSSWGDDRLGHNDFVVNPHGQGWHLDRLRFDRMLVRCVERAGMEVRRGHRVRVVQRRPGTGCLVGLGGERVVGRVVVDASGAGATVARSLGAARRPHDRLVCATTFLSLPASSSVSRLGLLEATENGWWYAARVPGDRLAVLAACEPDGLRRAALHSREGWVAAARATRHVAGLIEHARPIAGPAVRVVPSFVLRPVAADSWLAVGDAASTFDPIAAAGIHKALAGGLDAAAAIGAALAGDGGALERYAASVNVQFDGYLRTRSHLYRLERRWAAAPFWVRRRHRTPAPSGTA